jgi:hypothetical protein
MEVKGPGGKAGRQAALPAEWRCVLARKRGWETSGRGVARVLERRGVWISRCYTLEVFGPFKTLTWGLKSKPCDLTTFTKSVCIKVVEF